MGKHFLVFFLIFIGVFQVNGQLKYQNRLEFETKNDESVDVKSLRGDGLMVMFTGRDEYTYIHYRIFDNDLNIIMEEKVTFDFQLYLKNFDYDDGIIRLLFCNDEGNALIQELNIKNKLIEDNYFEFGKGEVLETGMIDEYVYVIARQLPELFVMTVYNTINDTLITGECEIKYHMDYYYLNLLCTALNKENDTFSAAIHARTKSKQEYMTVLPSSDKILTFEFDFEQAKVKSNIVEINKADEHIVSVKGRFSGGGELVLVSSYRTNYNASRKNRESGIQSQIINGSELKNNIRYPFNELLNREDFKEGFQQALIRDGNKISYAGLTDLHGISLIEKSNGEVYVLGFVTFNEHLPLYFNSVLYKIVHLFVAKLNTENEIVWDKQMKFNLLGYDEKKFDQSIIIGFSDGEYEEAISILLFENDKVTLYGGLNDEEIVRIYNREEVVPYYPKDKVKTSNSRMMYLYENVYLHYGIQKIKPGKRRLPQSEYLFFIEKVQI
ncbi:MAG: hypothetical protein GQ574_02850 [Crocinitomix sp.]|nr:hypothetical protein [Crocinitomix sp.]